MWECSRENPSWHPLIKGFVLSSVVGILGKVLREGFSKYSPAFQVCSSICLFLKMSLYGSLGSFLLSFTALLLSWIYLVLNGLLLFVHPSLGLADTNGINLASVLYLPYQCGLGYVLSG